MDEALEQIFKYLVWRDTKAAILLFIRNKDVTAVIKKAVEKVEDHPNYKRSGSVPSDERIDFVMHATGIFNGKSTSPCFHSPYGSRIRPGDLR